MKIEDALAHIEASGPGTLATIRDDGTPHLSVVSAAVVHGQLWFSVTQDRVKTGNVRRTPRASYLAGAGPWAAVDGPATLDEGNGLPERLRTYYRTLRGEHPDWDEYDAAMVADRRLLMVLRPERAYGFVR